MMGVSGASSGKLGVRIVRSDALFLSLCMALLESLTRFATLSLGHNSNKTLNRCRDCVLLWMALWNVLGI